jgi:hypothetical protein
MGANGNIGVIYAGRSIAGLGAGRTTVVGPIYLAEVVSRLHHTVARVANWDRLLCIFAAFVHASSPALCISALC